MKLSKLACAGGLRAILNLDSRINEGKQSPENVAGDADLPSIPPPLAKRDKVQRKFPQRGFLRNQHASTSGARSLGSKVYTELQGRGRIFWKVSQLRWGSSPTLGDDGGGSEQASKLSGASAGSLGKTRNLGSPWRRRTQWVGEQGRDRDGHSG